MDSFWGEERVGFEQGLDRLVVLGSVLGRKKGFYHFRHFAPNLGTAYIHFFVLCRVTRQNILCHFHQLLIQRNLFSVAHEIPGLSWQTERIKGTKILNGGNRIPILLNFSCFLMSALMKFDLPFFYCVAELLLHKIFRPVFKICLLPNLSTFHSMKNSNTPKFTKPR